MKYFLKKAVTTGFLFFAAFLIFIPQQINAQVSQETANLLRSVRIHALNERADPENFTLPLLNGGNTSLSDHKGKVVILNFWATWCPPCRAEMPSMEILYQRFKSQGLEILAVDVGENINTVRQFIHNSNYTFPVILDRHSRVSGIYGIVAFPTSYIIDREGKIIAIVVGSISWDTPEAITAFEALLNNR